MKYEYRNKEKKAYFGVAMVLPEELTIFGFKLTKTWYLSIAGIGAFILLLVCLFGARHWIRKEVSSYMEIE